MKVKEELMKLSTLVHGDAKLDNFLFKKEGYGEEEKERLDNYMKNLPPTPTPHHIISGFFFELLVA